MDVILTALGEFVWTSSCAVVNFCLSSGLSVLVVFVSFLCAILASAFYKYTTSREEMLSDGATHTLINHDYDDIDNPITLSSATDNPVIETASTFETVDGDPDNSDRIRSSSEIEIRIEDSSNENRLDPEQTSNNILIDTIEGSEEEIQRKQIANIYRLLNDQHLLNNWTTTDFLDQLKMYGLETYDEDELELS